MKYNILKAFIFIPVLFANCGAGINLDFSGSLKSGPPEEPGYHEYRDDCTPPEPPGVVSQKWTQCLYFTGDDGMPYTSDDYPARCEFERYDSNGNLIQHIVTSDFGLMSSAKNISHATNATNYTYDASGNMTLSVEYTKEKLCANHPDKDQGLIRINKITYDASNNRLTQSHYYAGPDDIAGTIDDQPGYMYKYTYDVSSKPLRFSTYLPGSDGILETPDDVWYNYTDTQYDNQSRELYSLNHCYEYLINYTLYATDLTGNNDRIISYIQYSYGTNEKFTYSMQNLDPVTISPASDTIHSYQHITYDSAQKPLFHYRYFNSGKDSIWNTSDDVADYTEYSYDASGLLLWEQRVGPGNDGTLGNSDDKIYYFYAYDYDASASRTKTTYWSPGADNIKFTPDDILWSYTLFW